MSWMITADKLDEQQNHFIFEKSRSKENIWIKGFAGSGKSVLLIHTIIDKIKENPNANICVVVFTHSLIQMFAAGIKELGIPEKNIRLTTYHQFMKDNNKFDYIFCDEVQDLPKSVLENMKSRTKQLILAGDSNQSIYSKNPSTHEPTVSQSEIETIINSTPYELNTIYRLTKSIIKVVSHLIPKMNILSSKTDRTKKDVSVRLCKGNSEYQEVEYILSQANEAISVDESVVIILPTHNDIIKFINIALDINGKQEWNVVMDKWGQKPDWYLLNNYLSNNGINIEYVGNGAGNLFDSVRIGKMIIMTYHSVKGLDFDNVFLPFVSTSLKVRNKTIFMVGMTRSKEALYLTYSGNMHEYVSDFKDECTIIDINSINNNDDDLDFDF
jgi:superfamily I DNA/RNA helicase